jgi:hypothetical protein
MMKVIYNSVFFKLETLITAYEKKQLICVGNELALDSYSGGARFLFQPGYLLS